MERAAEGVKHDARLGAGLAHVVEERDRVHAHHWVPHARERALLAELAEEPRHAL